MLAYLNGDYVPATDALLPVTDGGFVQGTTIAEQLRTFLGQPFQVDAHLRRLRRGLKSIDCQHAPHIEDLDVIIERVVEHNYRLLSDGDDLGVTVFVTPGIYPAYRGADDVEQPTVCVHTYLLPFHRWSSAYEAGQVLQSVNVRQVPNRCWPNDVKCRSRMHYYLAAREAHRRQSGSTALLLDQHGKVCETPTANIVAYFAADGLVSPVLDQALPGVSLAYLFQIAAEIGIPTTYRAMSLNDLAAADEILLTSTPHCVLPSQSLDGHSLKPPGEVFQQLIEYWSDQVGVDIIAQATRFAMRADS